MQDQSKDIIIPGHPGDSYCELLFSQERELVSTANYAWCWAISICHNTWWIFKKAGVSGSSTTSNKVRFSPSLSPFWSIHVAALLPKSKEANPCNAHMVSIKSSCYWIDFLTSYLWGWHIWPIFCPSCYSIKYRNVNSWVLVAVLELPWFFKRVM